MARAGSGKWQQLGIMLVQCAGTNLPMLQSGINAGITQDDAPPGIKRAAAKGQKPKKRRANARDLVEAT